MYWTSRWSSRARANRSPAWNVFSMRSPRRTFRSFMRTCALPRPILMCWNSTIWYRLPSSSIVMPRLISPVLTIRRGVLEKPVQGLRVARHSFTYHLMRRDVPQIRMVPERLALADVAHVDLDDRERTARDGVAEDDRGVGEPAGIDDGTIRVGVLLQEVDE